MKADRQVPATRQSLPEEQGFVLRRILMSQLLPAKANLASQPKRGSLHPGSKQRQTRLVLRRDPIQKQLAEARPDQVSPRWAAPSLRTNPWTNCPVPASKVAQWHFSANQAPVPFQRFDPTVLSGAVKFR